MMLGPSLLDRIRELTSWHIALGVTTVALVAWLMDLVLRRRWTLSRSRLMKAQLGAMRSAFVLAGMVWLGEHLLTKAGAADGLQTSIGFFAVVAWLNAGLRVGRVIVFAWLFARSRDEGVPLLLVDIFTIVAASALSGALLHALFRIEVASILATSAVLSVVLGLALQDTLGQLFAGISLQLDPAFRLGDWVEVRSGSERISGQVIEVSWRATVLLTIGEEMISIPNKTIAQGLVLNFSGRERPFVRSHLFRVPLDADVALVKQLLLQAARETKGVVTEPRPIPLLIETTESWLTIKMINFVTDFGSQYTIGDAFQTRALELLAEQGIRLAAPRMELLSPATRRDERARRGPGPSFRAPTMNHGDS